MRRSECSSTDQFLDDFVRQWAERVMGRASEKERSLGASVLVRRYCAMKFSDEVRDKLNKPDALVVAMIVREVELRIARIEA